AKRQRNCLSWDLSATSLSRFLASRAGDGPHSLPRLIEIVIDVQHFVDPSGLEDTGDMGLRGQQDDLALTRHLRFGAADESSQAERREEVDERHVHDDERLMGRGEARELQVDLLRAFHVETPCEANRPYSVLEVLVG